MLLKLLPKLLLRPPIRGLRNFTRAKKRVQISKVDTIHNIKVQSMTEVEWKNIDNYKIAIVVCVKPKGNKIK
jgi:hypothetical protein